ncbi:TerB N-terminal domain-containing protein [uncultured Leuconostoc sp.]|uniref:TerB N-terminal domain-containing protein n=1 Tax=uncultured Leuconostoc sp. TaxID=173262 RepID=UPI0025E19553|nr:TerB N-terminal domain-containing protein [uncultured Leuconostoc sp.]
MNLSELVLYAKEKYNIIEQYKWPKFPSFSVLVDPSTNKWVAVLMRQKNAISGEKIERCDIKYAQEIPTDILPSYLSAPFRMHGPKWLGVRFDDSTDPDVVYRIFDKALEKNDHSGNTIILNSKPTQQQYRAVPLTFTGATSEVKENKIPEKIIEMNQLYAYGDNSFTQKCRNFYVQGQFMVDYEDVFPYNVDIHRYFTTYHDLGLKQLRGYFSWRTDIRKGIYKKITTSLAYLYLYELINGIGTSSVADSLEKIKAFEINYLDSGIGDSSIRLNSHKWLFELAVINGIEPDTTYEYADAKTLQRDNALMILREPENHDDKAIFDALCLFGGHKVLSSVVIKKHDKHGIHLFAQVWRSALKTDNNLFSACFGTIHSHLWYPLGNAVYYQATPQHPLTYQLNDIRKYTYEDNAWYEQSYQKFNFHQEKLDGLLRETDRMLRLYLKTGYPLKARDAETWAAPYIETVIKADRDSRLEADKPKVTIQFSSLDKIRSDAFETRDSLLTDEEIDISENVLPPHTNIVPKTEKTGLEKIPSLDSKFTLSLDRTQLELLSLLVRGESITDTIREMHGMPEVITDTLNEALFDDIGDSVLQCDGDTIVLIEDYRDDLIEYLGEI